MVTSAIRPYGGNHCRAPSVSDYGTAVSKQRRPALIILPMCNNRPGHDAVTVILYCCHCHKITPSLSETWIILALDRPTFAIKDAVLSCALIR